MRQNPILMDMDEDEQNHPLVLARNVKSFAVECWDTNSVDWVDEWDYTNQIPPMVRFTLVLGGNKNNNGFGNTGPELAVTRVIAFPSGTVPVAAQTQSAASSGTTSAVKQQPQTPTRLADENSRSNQATRHCAHHCDDCYFRAVRHGGGIRIFNEG